MKNAEDHANRHQWQIFAAIAVGIGLFFAVGLGRKLIDVMEAQAGGQMNLVELFISLLGCFVGGGILGILLYFLVLYICFWRKT